MSAQSQSNRRIAVVIVNYRTPDLALRALASLQGERAREPGLQVVIVDGGSGDGSAKWIAKGIEGQQDWASLLPLDINGGFGWANNQAMLRLLQSETPPDYIHLLNPDTEIEPGAVSRLADALDAHPNCGAVGSQLLETDGSPAGSAFDFVTLRKEFARGPRLGIIDRLVGIPPFNHQQPASEVDWVTGASVMFRSEALRQAGLFDSGFFLYFEEMELMARIRRHGWTIRHEPASRVKHVGGAATGVNGSLVAAQRPPLPRYWYDSRRRYFALVYGRATGLAASLLWLAGHGTLLARRAIGSGRGHPVVAKDARRLMAYGLAPKKVVPAFPRWDEPPGKPPVWMAKG